VLELADACRSRNFSSENGTRHRLVHDAAATADAMDSVRRFFDERLRN